MEKHIPLVGILNIVYRSLAILCSFVIYAIAFGFRYLFEIIMRYDHHGMEDVPIEVLNIVPIILFIVGTLILIVSIIGLIGAIGVMKRKEWGRITVLVVSFFSLLNIPLGTLLGVYSIWVLFNDETIKLFNPVPIIPKQATTPD